MFYSNHTWLPGHVLTPGNLNPDLQLYI